ncbi:hypothetical protein EYC84_005825 [Monilinia fructicola]|uniref:Uncharacterized protein n=1 Tax=Monilinia fructicola TaxID=38448 RepID=A0A5M9JXS7_MONFR|nr:hypothetical protein EYC84_005825 [Monilinia fructicola]
MNRFNESCPPYKRKYQDGWRDDVWILFEIKFSTVQYAHHMILRMRTGTQTTTPSPTKTMRENDARRHGLSINKHEKQIRFRV